MNSADRVARRYLASTDVLKLIHDYTSTDLGTIRRNQCFSNARNVSFAVPGVGYAEGIVTFKGLVGELAGVEGDEPMQHAWNVIRGRVVDLTGEKWGFSILKILEQHQATHSQMKKKEKSLYFAHGPIFPVGPIGKALGFGGR